MALNAHFDALDNVVTTGRFFVDLTRRLGPGTVVAGEDAIRLAHAFGLHVPHSLAGATIETTHERHEEMHLAQAAGTRPAGPGTQVVVVYPPEDVPDPVAMKFKKCFQVCGTVAGAKVCAQVCVDISISLGGVHGTFNGSVSVTF